MKEELKKKLNELIEIKNNPMSDQRTVRELREEVLQIDKGSGFSKLNVYGFSQDDNMLF